MKVTMKYGISSKFVAFTLWYLCFPISFALAGEKLEGGAQEFISGAFLAYRMQGENAPSAGPTMSSAPTASFAPSAPPSISSAPSVSPSESLAPSRSPSEAPTMAPTITRPPSGAPSSIPTESPAPSASPSIAPTERPSASPSDSPTPAPSVSLRPSSQPSDAPTDFPTVSPSSAPSSRPSISSAPSEPPSPSPTDAPSAPPSVSPAPTRSAAPSKSPSDAPTLLPSSSPSVSPTDSPSSVPSESPSNFPSLSPSAAPSVSSAPTTSAPSSSPSSSPTEESFKLKQAVTVVNLPDIDQNMTKAALADFEITTMAFIRDTQTASSNYTLQMLAITVLSQKVLFSNATATSNNDKTKTGEATVALEVTFRTVGVVTKGVAPRDFNLSNVINPGFDSYHGEFLYRLSEVDDFFAPLAQHVDTTTLITMPAVAPDDTNSKKGQVVATVMFATVALTIALAATIFAVRRHWNKLQAEKVAAPPQLEYPGYGTRTLSDDPASHDEENPAADTKAYHYDQSNYRRHETDALSDLSRTITPPGKTHTERVDTDNMTLQLNIIDDEEIEMEDIGLTPLSGPVGYRTSFSSPPKRRGDGGPREQRDESSTFMDLRRSSFGQTFGMKKWLTPKKTKHNNSNIESMSEVPTEAGTEQTKLLNKKSRKSIDPDAIKVPTHHESAKESTQLPHTTGKATAGTTPNPSKTNPSDGKTPLAIPVNFFGRNGDARSDATSNNVGGTSTTSSFFTKMASRKNAVFTGRTSNASDRDFLNQKNGNYNHTYKFGSDDPFALNEQNLATLQTNSNENVEATFPDNRSDFERKRAIFESLSSASSPTNITHNDKRNNAQASARGSGDANATNRDFKKVGPTAAQPSEVDSVYSEQSELDLNELGIETTLGAYAPNYGNNTPVSRGSFVEEHHYGSRPNMHDDSTQYSDKFSFKGKQHKAIPAMDASVARSMASAEEKRRISLSTAIKMGNTYDVFAPPGPIGIVVDTSKMGPSVHSLKSTSPMLGLVNPGDLIIALDDEDTRNMTAASLTRLMAKKSRQRERKITLLAPDGF